VRAARRRNTRLSRSNESGTTVAMRQNEKDLKGAKRARNCRLVNANIVVE
jgi:hypothetical protein